MNPGHNTLEPIIQRHSRARRRRPALATPPARQSPVTGAGDSSRHRGLATGYSALDASLAHNGWPTGTAIEVLSDGCGIGALGLFLPAMETLSAQRRWQAFIAPPSPPYQPLLAARGIDTGQVLLVHPRNREEQLLSMERALRSNTCSAVFCWLGAGDYRHDELRRLQLAAACSGSLAVIFRASQAARGPAPAGLRLQMRAYRQVHILKQLGGEQGRDVDLSPAEDTPHQPQLWELPVDTGSVWSSASTPVAG